jgi:two-component system chemotaxis sensor kinase CheA
MTDREEPLQDSSYSQRFIAEAREHLAVMSAAMIELEKNPLEVQASIERLLRAAHSIKGGAGFSGRRNVERLAHAMEEVAEHIRDGELTAGPEVIDGLLASLDRMIALVDDLEHSDKADISELLGRLEQWVGGSRGAGSGRLASGGLAGLKAGAGSQVVSLAKGAEAAAGAVGEFELSQEVLGRWHPESGYLYGVKLDLAACEKVHGLSPHDVVERLERVGAVLESHVRPSGPRLGEGLPVAPMWWLSVVSSALDRGPFVAAMDIESAWVVTLREPGGRKESAAAASSATGQGATGLGGAVVKPKQAAATSLRVSVSLIDRMMALTGELVLVRNQAVRSGESPEGAFRGLLRRLDAVTNDLQDAALGMRTQPVGMLFDRFPRMVRDLGRQLGKQIDLKISGSEVELDKTILELLADPLTHLIRNCCDHGIEMPERRIAAGKAAGGRIMLSARQDRGQIVIEVSDDGRGIDRQAVRRKAMERQLKSAEELEAMSPRQIHELILLPGFSTASQVTDVSGRGVGMDVVKTNLDQVGGLLEIDSEVGSGTSFSLRLPLTLAIMPCLLVGMGGQTYAIPQRDIEEVVLLDGSGRRGRIERDEGGEVMRWRDRLLPVARLQEVLHGRAAVEGAAVEGALRAAGGAAGAAVGHSYAAVSRLGSRRFVLLFDRIDGSENIVVKPLPRLMRPLGIYSATTILGDGSVALILNSEGIARRGGVLGRAVSGAARSLIEAPRNRAAYLLFRCGGTELLAVDMGAIQRVVLFRSERIERIGELEMVNIDGSAVQLVRPERELRLSGGEEPETQFLILPRNGRGRAGLVASSLVDSVALDTAVEAGAANRPGVVGTAIVRGEIALVLDLEVLFRGAGGKGDVAAGGVPAGRGGRILLVEDTAFFQKLIMEYLRADGHEVVLAVNGSEGLGKLGKEMFDAVISDIEMPVMDGLTFARAVRADPRHATLPMLAMTTLDTTEIRQKASKSGFDHFEVKLDRSRLSAVVEAMLGARRVGTTGGVRG